VIEDEHDVRSVLAEALPANGYPVYLADGAKAIKAMNARRYDLIITGLRMSVAGGLQVLALAKDRSPNAKLIVITGYPSEDSLRYCQELRVTSYLVKPFSVSEFRGAASNVLRGVSPTIQ